MKRYIVVLAVLFAAFSSAPAQAAPKAKAAQSGCSSYSYLHVDCATQAAIGWVQYDCCYVYGRNNYDRANANRVDIDVKAYRGGGTQCRWVIVRGHDFSKYAYYHPDRSWRWC